MKKIVIAVVCLVVISISAAGYWYYSLQKDANEHKQTVQPPTAEEKTNELIDKASQSDGAAASDQADKLKKLAQGTSSKDDKDTYLSGVVDVYTNAGDKTAALGAAKDYEKSSESAHSAEVLAGTYYAKGDYKNAAKYYGIAASRSEKPDRSTERAPYNDYMNLKREAESHL